MVSLTRMKSDKTLRKVIRANLLTITRVTNSQMIPQQAPASKWQGSPESQVSGSGLMLASGMYKVRHKLYLQAEAKGESPCLEAGP